LNKFRKFTNKQFSNRFIRFLIVGVLNTIVGYGTFAIGIYCNLYYYTAYILSYIIGVINSYILNKKFTFKSNDKSLKEPLRFLTVYLFSFIIGSIAIYILIDLMGTNAYIAGLINLIFTTLISWFGHNKFSFKNIK